MIDDDDNYLIGIAVVAVVLCADDTGDGNCNRCSVGIKS